MYNDGIRISVINSVINGLRYEPETTKRRNTATCDANSSTLDNIVSDIRTQKSTCFRHIEKRQEKNGFGTPTI